MKRAGVVAAVLLVVAVLAAVVRTAQFRGEAKPGVHVLGLDVGGKSRSQIQTAIERWSAQSVTIRAGGHSYHVPRGWLVAVDVRRSADHALAAGNATALVVPAHVDVAPVMGRAPDARNVLGQIDRAGRTPISATVRIDGTHAVTTRARTGLALDHAALLRRLAAHDVVVDAPFRTIAPKATNAAARAAAADVDKLLGGGVAIDYHGARRGALSQAQLARALHVRPDGHRFAVAFDGDLLTRLVRPRLGKWIVRAHNAQFVVRGKGVRIVPSRPGHDVDPAQLVSAVVAAADGDHIARVDLGARDPDLTTAKAQALGINRQLVSYTTQMGESSSNRIHNVHLMADFIDGTIVKPGDTFSFNAVVGPRTSERGFLEGQEIIGSLVLPSIGGGVCQTATTLFNDAFELGLPILARENHNLYLAHYPLGRDATVSWGGPDFKFRNDLKHGLLIKSSYTDQTLTFTVYGTSEGRRVVSHTGPQTTLDTSGNELRRRPERTARLGARGQGDGRARLRHRGVAQGLRALGKAAAQRRLQVALHPRQPDDGLRAGAHAARAVHRPAGDDLGARHAALLVALEDVPHRRLDVVGEMQQIEVNRGDHPVGEQALGDPLDHRVPVVDVEEHDREVLDLPRLDQRQRLVQLVERAEAAGEDDEALRRADEAHLARIEVIERVRDVEVRIRVLFVRQLDVEADREPVAFARASVRSLHHAAAAARDHRPPALGETPADGAGRLVGCASFLHARRAEERGGGPIDQGHLLEACAKLVRDLLHRRVDVELVRMVEDLAVVGHRRCCGTWEATMPRTSIAAVAKYNAYAA